MLVHWNNHTPCFPGKRCPSVLATVAIQGHRTAHHHHLLTRSKCLKYFLQEIVQADLRDVTWVVGSFGIYSGHWCSLGHLN